MLRTETGEFAEPMPGSSADFVTEEQDLLDMDDSSPPVELELPRLVQQVVQVSSSSLVARIAGRGGCARYVSAVRFSASCLENQ